MAFLNPSDLLEISIHSFGENGEGIGDYLEQKIYVDGAIPGERVAIQITSSHKNYAHAKIIDILTPSSHRVKPICTHFGVCGGCQIMHVEYPQQLILKQNKVIKALEQYGSNINVKVEPCLPSPQQLKYRNKVQLPAQIGDHGIFLGLYARSSHDLVEIDTCHIHCSLGEEVFNKVKKIIKESTLGNELRYVLIKSCESLSESLVILVTNSENRDLLYPVAEQIMDSCNSVKGVVHNVNSKEGNAVLGPIYHLLKGTDYIHQELKDLTFTLSPASFFQVNAAQAVCLYAKALEFAEVCGNETVLDAYCGVGTISLYFAKHVKKIIGIECIPQAIENARENAKLNGIDNAEFICAHAEEYITQMNEVDIVILNPPRKGCDRRFLECLKRLGPKKIVYISCNPKTLARDLSDLCNSGYTVNALQPYDMFPQTAHVECVAKLQR